MTITAPAPVVAPPKSEGRNRIGLAVLLVGTAIAYTVNISVNGMANSFYAGAAWADSVSWKAWFFGSLDPSNFITVDKPPVSQWIMGLSGRIFGFSSASMLIPEALLGVATVALVYALVARVSSPRAGLLAGFAMAVLPCAAMMFRFNNPDAAMVFLMTASAYCTVRATERGSWRWLTLAGVALGFAFLAKMLEGLMIAPALVVAYLVAAPVAFWTRIRHLLIALAALIVSSSWYVVATIVWPTDSRPFMTGSTDNSFMNLVLGYNGLARILGRNHGGGQSGPPQAAPEQFAQHGGFGNQAGITRLFGGEIGFEISWLLPAALVGFVLVLVARRHAPRTDAVRAAALVVGLWLVIDGLVLSFMKSMAHAYYALAIGPAIAALVGLAAHEMWSARERVLGRVGGSLMIAAAGGWGYVLLARNSDWLPWLRWVVLAVTVVAVAGLLLPFTQVRRGVAVFACVGIVVGLSGSTAYALATLEQPHLGGSPSVGPARNGSDGGWGMRGGVAADPALDALLDSTDTRWSAAVDRSSAAATLELSSRTPVMAIGGFSNDPVPDLARFQQYVADHDASYFVTAKPKDDENEGNRQRRGAHEDITEWVESTFPSQAIGDWIVFDLRQQ